MVIKNEFYTTINVEKILPHRLAVRPKTLLSSGLYMILPNLSQNVPVVGGARTHSVSLQSIDKTIESKCVDNCNYRRMHVAVTASDSGR